MKNSNQVIIMILLLLLAACSGGAKKPDIPGEKIREYANELYNRYLFIQAVEQYQHYLDFYSLDQNERAGITYRIGNIYFERLHDYENALTNFLKIKSFYPGSQVATEVNKKIIACLERLQRPEDARQALQESSALEPMTRATRPGSVIARFGSRSFTQGDLDYELSQLPPEIRAQYKTKEKKLEFLRRLVATELMYDSAKRAGLDQDKDVLANVFQAKKSLMVQKLLLDQISEKVKISAEEVELYYKAHSDRYKDKAFTEVQQQVAQDLFTERQQQAYTELLASYLRTENVKIFDDLVK